MRRVMVIGQPGSGKSTLARAIGHAKGLPVVHIDKIHWMSGWVERPRDEKHALVAEVHARDAWVFEGGISVTWPERLARADTLIWLDLPLPLRAWRVAKRTALSFGRTRPDMPEGCPEKTSLQFWRWIWNTRHTGRIKPLRILADPPAHLTVHHLTTRAEVAAFEATLPLPSA